MRDELSMKKKRSKDNYFKISIQQLEPNNEFMRVTEMLHSSTLGEKCPYSELFWFAFPAFELNTAKNLSGFSPNAGKCEPE